jgi:hypothetical protein
MTKTAKIHLVKVARAERVPVELAAAQTAPTQVVAPTQIVTNNLVQTQAENRNTR